MYRTGSGMSHPVVKERHPLSSRKAYRQTKIIERLWGKVNHSFEKQRVGNDVFHRFCTPPKCHDSGSLGLGAGTESSAVPTDRAETVTRGAAPPRRFGASGQRHDDAINTSRQEIGATPAPSRAGIEHARENGARGSLPTGWFGLAHHRSRRHEITPHTNQMLLRGGNCGILAPRGGLL